MKATRATTAIFSLANLSGRLFKQDRKAGFYNANGANNKEVASIESFNAA